MEFPTIQFVYFCLIALTIAWLLRQNRTIQKVFLLAASYFFAWKFQPLFLATLIEVVASRQNAPGWIHPLLLVAAVLAVVPIQLLVPSLPD